MNKRPARTVSKERTRPGRLQLFAPCKQRPFPSRYSRPMKLASLSAAILGALVATAAAQPKKAVPPPAATMPAVGDTLTVTGAPTWSEREWLYDVPSDKDAAGKVVIHWFCAPKVKTCTDDLARIVTLKENGRAYVVA